MSAFLRMSAITIGALSTGLTPLFIALSIAEQHDWDRDAARSIAFVVTMALFGIWALVLKKITRRQAKREIGEEFHRLMAPHRDDERKNR